MTWPETREGVSFVEYLPFVAIIVIGLVVAVFAVDYIRQNR